VKAIVFERYGPPQVLQLREIPTPSPGARQVLLRIRAASVNAADWHIMRANPFFARLAVGLLRPRFGVLGTDVAGSVEAVGAAVTKFAPGDGAFGNLFACGLGGFAEYAAVREDALLPKPVSSSFEQAAATPLAAVTALQALRTVGKVKAGTAVLINGAAGGVGTFAVQIAKAFGAEVTGVCSTTKLNLVRSIGADAVID
jgi:NADPH:quinone reductase-like Zn-dependent oxidoreductase